MQAKGKSLHPKYPKKTGVALKVAERDLTQLRKESKRKEVNSEKASKGIDVGLIQKVSLALGTVNSCFEISNVKTRAEIKLKVKTLSKKIKA